MKLTNKEKQLVKEYAKKLVSGRNLTEGANPISTRTKIMIVVDLINNKFGDVYQAQYDELKSFYGNEKMISIKSPNTKIPLELENFLKKSGYSIKVSTPSKRSGYYRLKCYIYKN